MNAYRILSTLLDFRVLLVGASMLCASTVVFAQQKKAHAPAAQATAATGCDGQACSFDRINEVASAQVLYVQAKARIVQSALDAKERGAGDALLKGVVKDYLDDFCLKDGPTGKVREVAETCARRYVRLQQLELYRMARGIITHSDQSAKLSDGASADTQSIAPTELAGSPGNTQQAASNHRAPRLTAIPTARELKDRYEAERKGLRAMISSDYAEYQNDLRTRELNPNANDFVTVDRGNPAEPAKAGSESSYIRATGLDSELYNHALRSFQKAYKTGEPNAAADWERLKQDMLLDAKTRYEASGVAFSIDAVQGAKGSPLVTGGRNDASIRLYQEAREFLVSAAYKRLDAQGVELPREVEDAAPSLAGARNPATAGTQANVDAATAPKGPEAGASMISSADAADLSRSDRQIKSTELKNPVAPEGASFGDRSIFLDPVDLLKPISP